MGRIYRNARTVLVCLGQDLDEGADGVAGLVKENADLVSKYGLIAEMPVLAPDDSLFDDPRWKSLATLTKCTWFTRAWVL
jgi:Heterokaryon incompatibility protein (HET)